MVCTIFLCPSLINECALDPIGVVNVISVISVIVAVLHVPVDPMNHVTCEELSHNTGDKRVISD